jgi:hypothetical protein
VTLLCDASHLAARRETARSSLAPLASSLAAELDRLLPDEDFFIPSEKAGLTRAGGRCTRDGVLLEFDPRSPRRHRCPRCGTLYDEEEHYRWWVMGYQLWLAERAVHAALLWSLRGEARHRGLAAAILRRLAERYLSYPNVDNVLGPTRPFFSTYLESIWLLQLTVALDLLEENGGDASLAGFVQERLVEPSAALIAQYDEGLSNRQVWNNAALAAAGALLHRDEWVRRGLAGPSGLAVHLEQGLLADGTWYEGENYHLFAHRGLWYAERIARGRDMMPPESLVRRFAEGFVTPFLTALPDFTVPSRRDSPYRVSLRQWRLAESAELGWACGEGDERLAAALTALYQVDVPTGDTARWRSTAEAERNVPPARLTRADLGWKSLLFATPDAAPAVPASPARPVLLEGQGFAVMRPERGRVYVALDYGHGGGGHGHPDRLNLWLVHGPARVLEDVGTGSYVDAALHWYRSTLAHNAPLIDGRSQPPVDGRLEAWDQRDGVGWIVASGELAPGVVVRRAVVVTDDYLVDTLTWTAPREVQCDLPIHVNGELLPAPAWTPASLTGGTVPEDGFAFVERAECGGAAAEASLRAEGVTAWIILTARHEWWRCTAPGPPGEPVRPFLLVRSRGRAGSVVGVWAWREGASAARIEGGVRVRLADGTVHEHLRLEEAWRIIARRADSAEAREIVLSGWRPDGPASPRRRPSRSPAAPLALRVLRREPGGVGELTRWAAEGGPGAPPRWILGRAHYRRTENTWSEAGAPEARVSLGVTPMSLWIEATISGRDLVFAPARAENPLDNEPPDVNSDGVQIHLRWGDGAAPLYSWILVPEPRSGRVRVTPRLREGPPLELHASWRLLPDGYQVLVRLPRPPQGGFSVDVIVNEIAPGRERRRGQLVLSGAGDGWAYLRGDRQEPAAFLRFRTADA